jgi:glucosamine kinase
VENDSCFFKVLSGLYNYLILPGMEKTILIGDVGSTKSTWWYNTDKHHEIHLEGFNPMTQPPASAEKLFASLSAMVNNSPIREIWYYGAGVIEPSVAHRLHDLLAREFRDSQIHVSSDLIGAAIAACGHEAGTVAILGTGSHAAVFDGKKILRQAISIGYILGDEGGGCDIGKSLLQSYFYKEMPEALHHEMNIRLPDGRSGLLKGLSATAAPNQFLADFARVAVLFQEHPWVKDLVSSRFKLFVKRHLLPLSPDGQVHIVGSIGCIFAGLIQQELENSGLSAGKFVKNPAHRLFEIHLEHGQKEK